MSLVEDLLVKVPDILNLILLDSDLESIIRLRQTSKNIKRGVKYFTNRGLREKWLTLNRPDILDWTFYTPLAFDVNILGIGHVLRKKYRTDQYYELFLYLDEWNFHSLASCLVTFYKYSKKGRKISQNVLTCNNIKVTCEQLVNLNCEDLAILMHKYNVEYGVEEEDDVHEVDRENNADYAKSIAKNHCYRLYQLLCNESEYINDFIHIVCVESLFDSVEAFSRFYTILKEASTCDDLIEKKIYYHPGLTINALNNYLQSQKKVLDVNVLLKIRSYSLFVECADILPEILTIHRRDLPLNYFLYMESKGISPNASLLEKSDLKCDENTYNYLRRCIELKPTIENSPYRVAAIILSESRFTPKISPDIITTLEEYDIRKYIQKTKNDANIKELILRKVVGLEDAIRYLNYINNDMLRELLSMYSEEKLLKYSSVMTEKVLKLKVEGKSITHLIPYTDYNFHIGQKPALYTLFENKHPKSVKAFERCPEKGQKETIEYSILKDDVTALSLLVKGGKVIVDDELFEKLIEKKAFFSILKLYKIDKLTKYQAKQVQKLAKEKKDVSTYKKISNL